MKKNYSTFSFANCCKAFMATVMMLATINLQAQSCVGGSPTSPGANVTISACTGASVAVLPTDVLVSAAPVGATVNLYTLGDVAITNTGAGIAGSVGKVVKAEVVTSAGVVICWGYIKLEDKTAPTVVKPIDITIQCNAAAAVSLPTSTTGTPTITDCSATTSSYADVMVSMGCLQSLARVIDRTWTVKDAYGNVTVSAAQRITVSRTIDNTVTAADALPVTCPLATPNTLGMFEGGNSTLLCSVTGSTGAQAAIDAVKGPFVILGGTRYYLADNTVCGLSARVIDTRTLALCPGSFKTVRIWRVTDLCGTLFPATNLTMSCDIQQVIVFTDDVAPTASYSTTNFNLVADGTTTCAAVSPMIPGMIPATVKLQGVPTGVISMGATTTIKPRSAAGMCGAVDIDMTITPADACGELTTSPVSVNDSRLTVSAGATAGTWRITGRIMNVSTTTFSSFIVAIVDKCGNTTKRTVQFVYEDNISPVAICDGVTATLNNLKTATVTGESFNQRSSDNCGVTAILVAKNTVVGGQDRPGTFCDEQIYGCSDTNATRKIWIRYIDFRGNYTDCCVPISILDKAPISCSVGTIDPISCNDVTRLNNYTSLFVPPVVFYDGCDAIDTIITNTGTAINCGVGSYTRTWVFGAKNALGEQRTAVCSQTLNITSILGFRVTPITNLPLTCSGSVSTAEQDRQAVIAGLKPLHNGGTTTTYTTCSAPVVDVTESTYSNTEFCKVIVRTFVIKDLCNFSTVTSSITQGTAYTTVGGDFQSITDADGRHYIIFTRTITIKDVTAPTSNQIDPVRVCYTNSNATCNFGFAQDLNGDDLCTGGTSVPGVASGSSLFYSWVIVNATTGVEITNTNSRGTTKRVSASGLAFGNYIVYYTVSDLCGNISIRYQFTVTGRDCKAPEILVHNKVVALAGVPSPTTPNNPVVGMAKLYYRDIRNRITDNCDGDLTFESGKIRMELGTLTGNPTTPGVAAGVDSVMFNCTHVGTQYVYVWAVDNGGNWNFARATITVQDNEGVCTVRAMIAGAAATENGSAVKDVVMTANTNGVAMGSSTSTAVGAFQVGNLPVGANYQVRAAKTIDTDKKNGVTTLDIALISKHNLGIEALNTPYKVIAADVNKDGEVDGLDMLYIRRFILSITPTLPAGSAWRFVDKSYAFRNPANPFGEDFPEVVNLSNVPAGTTPANFTAVKLGDVNNSFDATQVRGAKALTFTANDMNVVAGNEYTVAINAANFNASAFQGTFAFEGATVKAVKAGNLNNTSDANFGMFNKAVTASWNGTSEASAEVVNITFVATKSGKLSDMLTVNSSVTMAEGYDAAGNAMNVTLKFNTGKVAGGEFALYQNTPNPVALSTTIGFNLPKDGQAKLTIYTAEGKVLSVINNNYKAGANQVTINKSDLNASGMLYYRLDTQDNSSTRKMIIIE